MAKGVATNTTITFGSGSSWKVYGAPIRKPESRDAVDVTSLDETVAHYVAGAVLKGDEFTITIADEGQTIETSTVSAAYSISSTITDGTSEETVSVSFNALLTKVSGGSIEGAGDRKATIELTFQPSGDDSASGNGGASST